MQDFGEALALAFNLVVTWDADLMEIVGLPLTVSLAAVLVACLVGLPPVVVGLIVYLHLSRVGPLGWLGLFYTPTTMTIAQVLLIAPIVAALLRQVLEELLAE